MIMPGANSSIISMMVTLPLHGQLQGAVAARGPTAARPRCSGPLQGRIQMGVDHIYHAGTVDAGNGRHGGDGSQGHDDALRFSQFRGIGVYFMVQAD